jgi:hypothetical protein
LKGIYDPPPVLYIKGTLVRSLPGFGGLHDMLRAGTRNRHGRTSRCVDGRGPDNSRAGLRFGKCFSPRK